jgi:hypothetical protein
MSGDSSCICGGKFGLMIGGPQQAVLFVRVVNPYKKPFQPCWRTDIYAAWRLVRAGAIPERAVPRHNV